VKRLLIVAGSVLVVELVLAIVVLRVAGLLTVVTDAAKRPAVLQSKAKKYPRQRVSDTSTVDVFAVSS
jgi:hypothetical protein